MGRFAIRIRDYSDEYSNVGQTVDGLVAADTWSVAEAIVNDLVAAIDGVTLGTIVSGAYTQNVVENADERPASPFAQRELGLRFFYHDGLDNKGYLTVPAPDLATIVLLPGSDLADLTALPVSTLVTAIQTHIEIEPGQPVTVDRAVVVGRNS